MLECVSDPAVTLREFTHVLSLSGSVMLYAAFSTLEFESKEHTQLIKAVNQPACWAEGSASVDDAIAAADFEIVSLDLMSPEYTERNMLDRDAKLTSEFATLARLRRASARIKAAMGTVWYERLVG